MCRTIQMRTCVNPCLFLGEFRECEIRNTQHIHMHFANRFILLPHICRCTSSTPVCSPLTLIPNHFKEDEKRRRNENWIFCKLKLFISSASLRRHQFIQQFLSFRFPFSSQIHFYWSIPYGSTFSKLIFFLFSFAHCRISMQIAK